MNCKRLTLSLCLLLALCGLTHAQSEVCSVTTFWVDKDPFRSSSRHLVGTFPLESVDKPIARLLRHEDSGISISVGVEVFDGIFEKEPRTMRLAISFVGKPENIFDEVETAEARSVYDKHWRWLTVSKSIEKEKRVYTFTFGCERIKSKRKH